MFSTLMKRVLEKTGNIGRKFSQNIKHTTEKRFTSTATSPAEVETYSTSAKLMHWGMASGILSCFAFLGKNTKSVFADNVFRLMDMDPIEISVKSLQIQDLYTMPLLDPHVEHRMRRSP